MRLKRINESSNDKDIKIPNNWEMDSFDELTYVTPTEEIYKFSSLKDGIRVRFELESNKEDPAMVEVSFFGENNYVEIWSKVVRGKDVYTILTDIDEACHKIRNSVGSLFGDVSVEDLFRMAYALKKDYLGGTAEGIIDQWYDNMETEFRKALS